MTEPERRSAVPIDTAWDLLRERAAMLYRRHGRVDTLGRVYLDDEYVGAVGARPYLRTPLDVVEHHLNGGW